MEHGGVNIEEVVLQGSPNFKILIPVDGDEFISVRAVYCCETGVLAVKNADNELVEIPMFAGNTLAISPTKFSTRTTGKYLIIL